MIDDVEIAKACYAIIEEHTGCEVTYAERLSDRGIDSLDTVEIAMALEEQFDISIQGDDEKRMTSVCGMVSVVRQHV